jgi:hypothetical protein
MPIGAAASPILAQRHEPVQGAEDCDTIHHGIEHRSIQFCNLPVDLLVGAITLDQGPKYHGNRRAGVHRDTLGTVKRALLGRWREQLLVPAYIWVVGFDVLQRLAHFFVKCFIPELLVAVHDVRGT